MQCLLDCIKELLTEKGIVQPIFITAPGDNTTDLEEVIFIVKESGGGRDIYKAEDFFFQVLVKTKSYVKSEEIMESIREILMYNKYESESWKIEGCIEITSAIDTVVKDYKCKSIHYESLGIKY